MSEHEFYRPGPRLVNVALFVAIAVVTFGLLLLARNKVSQLGIERGRGPSVNSQSKNNLKQMGMAMHGIASRHDGLLPPSVGKFPRNGPNGSIFYHMLSDIEQDNIYVKYQASNPSTATEGIRAYCARLDPSNPGASINLTSYASNATVFGLGGPNERSRYPQAFAAKGSSNVILFMERYAVVGPANIRRHTWPGIGDQENYLYPPGTPPEEMTPPQFDVVPAAARNDAPHAFAGKIIQVGMADGSARTITDDVARTFVYGDGRTATLWAWACSLDGPLGEAPIPAGW